MIFICWIILKKLNYNAQYGKYKKLTVMFTEGLHSCMLNRDAVSGIKICCAKNKTQQRHYVAVTAHQWENKTKNSTFYTHTHTGCTNPGCQVPMSTKFCVVVPNICGSSVWKLLRVTLLAPRILRRLLDFWKICEPLPAHTCIYAHIHTLCYLIIPGVTTFASKTW
jgi:hypothetical protein